MLRCRGRWDYNINTLAIFCDSKAYQLDVIRGYGTAYCRRRLRLPNPPGGPSLGFAWLGLVSENSVFSMVM